MATLVETAVGYKCKSVRFFSERFLHLTFTAGFSKPLGYVLFVLCHNTS